MATIQISEAQGVRSLHFGSDWVQGSMRVARPWALELEYTREMMASLLLRDEPDWPRRVLLVGLGAGSLAKFLYRHRPQAKLTAIEIDAAVVATAREFFKLPDDPARLRIHVEDGADYVARTRSRFDLILVDGFDAAARSGRLDSLPFYLDCKSRLGSEGIVVANLLSRRRTFRRSVEQFEQAFEGRTLLFPSCDSGNAIVFGAVGAPVRLRLGELKEAARRLKQETGLNLLPTLARVEHAHTCADGLLVV